MKKHTSDIAFSPSVKVIQEQLGSRENYEEAEDDPEWWPNKVTPRLAHFLSERDSFYLGTVSADGQPYIQHRGGPKGFLKILDERTLGFADFSGNRQYISFGNLQDNEKAFIFLMDYVNRERIKVWGTAKVVDDDPELLQRLTDPSYGGKPERAFVFRISTWDGNCPQHINPRYTTEEIQELPDCPCCEPTIKKSTTVLKVAEIIDETPQVKTFRMVNPNGREIPFEYLPGQFLTLDLEPGGKRIKRSYTIASTPTRRDGIEITVKREENGLVSNYLHDEIVPGTELKLVAPAGAFTFTGEEHDSIVLIAAGVGITPMMSVVRYLTDKNWNGDIFFLISFRREDDFIFRKEIDDLARQHENLRTFVCLSRASEGWQGSKGRITRGFIEESVPDIISRRVHICGPDPMMEDVESFLAEIGVPTDQVQLEAFGTAKRKPKPESAGDPKPQASAATVRFTASDQSANLPVGMRILDLADDIGVEIDNACRSGTCGSCKVKLLSGSVAMESELALDEDEKAAGVILACQATADADVEIEA